MQVLGVHTFTTIFKISLQNMKAMSVFEIWNQLVELK